MMLRTYNELKEAEHISEEEFFLIDRLQKIESVITKYGEDNFYISFSGGKDSTVLSALVDLAIPGNKIPRVYANTGIELNMVRDFVFKMQKDDPRIEVIKPSVPIKPMLEKEGYPFKSKKHAHHVDRYQRIGFCPSIISYLGGGDWGVKQQYPKSLKYQFTEEFKDRLRVSDNCCVNLKEKPVERWGKEHGKSIAIVGIMKDEGGRRENATCMLFKDSKLHKFQPMSVVTKRWEEWFIKEYQIKLCPIYYPPYNRPRTGCKGCPFSLHLQEELDMLGRFFPEERKQCELIFGPIYDEYRRIGFRLKRKGQIKGQINMFDCAC